MAALNKIILHEAKLDTGPRWTLLAAGDFGPSNRFNETQSPDEQAGGVIDAELQELIRKSDISMVNMEGALKITACPINKSGPLIQLDSATPVILKAMGFDVVTLANNHTLDYGSDGLFATLKACESAGLKSCGAGENLEKAMHPVELTIADGIRVAVFDFCEQEFGIAGDSHPGTAWISHPLALSRVSAWASLADVVVVVAHGGVEEVPFSPIQRQAQLRQFIDAGAALVIGHHPHVPQGWERHRGGIIFYSLGNFLFDYPDGVRYPKTEWGLLIQVHFCGRVLTDIELIPIETLIGQRVGLMKQDSSLQGCLGYLQRLSSLQARPDTALPYWQETAEYLWQTRYSPWLEHACADSRPVYENSIRSSLANIFQGAINKMRRQCHREENNSASEIKDGLALLNMIRNESHRWTIETALSVLSGDQRDFRTPEVKAEVKELLSWTTEE